MLVGSNPHEEQKRVRVAIADLRLEADICKGFAKLLKLRSRLGLVYMLVSRLLHSPRRDSKLTLPGKAVVDHIVDIEVGL